MAVRRSPARLDLQVELHADEERGQRARQHAQPVGGAEYARARRGAAVHVDGEAHDVGGDEHQDIARAAERDQVTVRPAARHRLCAYGHRSARDGIGRAHGTSRCKGARSSGEGGRGSGWRVCVRCVRWVRVRGAGWVLQRASAMSSGAKASGSSAPHAMSLGLTSYR